MYELCYVGAIILISRTEIPSIFINFVGSKLQFYESV